MYPRIPTLIYILLLVCPFLSMAQPFDIHSLLVKLQAAQQDTDRVNLSYAVSRYYWNKDPDSALLMGSQALATAEKAHYEKGMALAYLTEGVALGTKGQYPEALQCHLQALRISEKLHMEGLTGNNYSNIGIVYAAMKDYPRALQYFRMALQIAEHDKADTTRTGVAVMLINMGDVFKNDHKFDSALDYNERARRLVEQAHDSMNLSVVLLNMGDDYLNLHQTGKALSCLTQALQISEKLGDEEGIAWVYNSLAQVYYQSGGYEASIRSAAMSLEKAQDLHLPEIIKESCHSLYAGYKALKRSDLALYYRNREIAVNDSLYTLEKEKQVKSLQSGYELEKKQHQIDLLNKDRIIRENELARDSVKRFLYLTLAVVLGLGCFFLYRSNFQKQRLNRMLKSRNEEIRKKNMQLEEINHVKNKLLSIIGHDLRSPIATLQGFVDLLQQSALSQEQILHFSGKMSESLVGTSQLLNNLLHWAKSQMEGMQVNARDIDVRTLIGQNKRLAQGRAEKKQVVLLSEEATSPVMAFADEVMVDLVIRNLVENAIKFCGPADTISLSTLAGEANVAVTIKDTGQGIAAADHDKIFNQSVSYTTAGTAREKGSGLGLFLCKELVEKNGGRIWFESEPGKGTSFTFTLPAADPR
ncbi:tetratricopeptide repeat-containing sensor histidine kinase [Flavitalea sp. BT771]|uniref:tetratricopeptide repeat-containing sensor histidine kinase n=1 Tax=Flavitalea sp. BT771 TaxID=3063329 RepID=UPI0026E2AF20|nr:tetratricopeptide repeat-containing sensor histidine kinase [Flavitalea sp. BT771]MDO6430103.1 tetratricopeptide repeat-containing sensor histidine kinase [Flavitalea sp. BT771]MDV6219758.1 tetratricopeptide repeat-containing sensor histidine kinase [Flavitalea sp. BT771]